MIGQLWPSRRVPVLPPSGGDFFFFDPAKTFFFYPTLIFFASFLTPRRVPPRKKSPFDPRAYITPRLALRDRPGAWRWRKGQKSGNAVTLLFLEGRRPEHPG
jgi:hypothetical protein